jgi:sodium/hydrogen antiporter
MEAGLWFAFGGALLLVMSLGSSYLSRLPFSSAMLYLAIGVAFSPLWLAVTALNAEIHTASLETLAEIVVLISLFTSGLKLSPGLRDRRWMPSLRLAVVSMLITVALVAVAGMTLLGLSLGAAIVLGGILAPTDPVLASEVQVTEPTDRDQLRFALTGEGGLNDGTAFPIVMLGLGLMGLHEIGAMGWRWLAIDVVWAVLAGVVIGAALGTGVGKLVLYIRRTHKEAVGLDNFLAVGLIAAAYGAALMSHAYGFLAVFAAGAALRRVEQMQTAASALVENSTLSKIATPEAENAPSISHPGILDTAHKDELATDAKHASAYMAYAVLSFNEQLERIGEVIVVIVIGMLLWSVEWRDVSWLFLILLFFVFRPAAVALGLAGSPMSKSQKRLIAWFGIRGVGSLFYLMYVINHDLPPDVTNMLAATTLAAIAASIVLHGVSVTSLMDRYERRRVIKTRS